MKVFKKKVKKSRLYRDYVDILNGKLQLGVREADVFAVLLQLNSEWGSMVKEVGNILSTDVRRVLTRETLMKKNNLARYITSLKNKGVLVPTPEGKLLLNEIFVPDFITDEETKITSCEIKFVLEIV